jgi:hypothetical protein
MPKHKQAGQTTVLTKMTAEITRKHLQCRSHPQMLLKNRGTVQAASPQKTHSQNTQIDKGYLQLG